MDHRVRLLDAVGAAVPAELVPELPTNLRPSQPIDAAIIRCASRSGHCVAYTLPSLIDRLDVDPAVAGRCRPPGPRGAWRVGTRPTWTPLQVAL